MKRDKREIALRCAGFFLPVRVLSRLFRRLFLEGLAALNQAGRLAKSAPSTPSLRHYAAMNG